MKFTLMLLTLGLISQSAFANAIIYTSKTRSMFPKKVKDAVNAEYTSAKMHCNPYATYILDHELMDNTPDGSTRFIGVVRVYGEADAHAVVRLGKIDSNGNRYRERVFSANEDADGNLYVSPDCEAGGY